MSSPQPDLMSQDQARQLGEFARACKAALRAVSLYPAAHPSVAAALSRVAATGGALTHTGDVTLTVHPDSLLLDGRAAERPDAAGSELAALLHDRLVGSLRIEHGAGTDDWCALLLLLARPTDELLGEGGIAASWTRIGRGRLGIREIDYAEVLRERSGGDSAEWDRIIACCLQGDAPSLDDNAVSALLETLADATRFDHLLDHLQNGGHGGPALNARAAALVQMLQAALDTTARRGGDVEPLLQTAADAITRLTPEMLLAVLDHRDNGANDSAALLSAIVDHITDRTIAGFVAGAIAAEHGATERLAQAFETLVPDAGRRGELLALAHDDAQQGELGRDERFEDLWHDAASMLQSYSDTRYVPAAYGRELSQARGQAIEVERTADDPPERVRQWLATVSDSALRALDVLLLLDLLQVESDERRWQALAILITADVERRTLLGDVEAAERLAARLILELSAGGREARKSAAASSVERLLAGPLVRTLVLQLRKVDDGDVAALQRLCSTLGPGIVPPLAEALAVEENSRAIGRLGEILISFGAAGRQSVEQLKSSANPAVRRTAIDLLRLFGGDDALGALASMLHDSDPQVQRESIRAVVQIGTSDAYRVLEQAIDAGSTSRDTLVQELIGLRDDRAIPLLCYALNCIRPRGALVQTHADIMHALASLGAHPESTRTLRDVLYRGEWWAPARTRTLRQAAATALRRIGSAEALGVLDAAAATGGRGVRHAARAQASLAARRDRERERA